MTDPNVQPSDPTGQTPPPPAAPATPDPATHTAPPLTHEQDVQWGSFAHLGGVLGFLPSLIIWLVFKDRGAFTNTEAKEALNFQITLVFGYIISAILVVVFIGALLMWVVWIVGVVFSIIAFLQAKDGKHYRYPFAIRLIK
ncbi:putative Tic20 family protein [Agromyces sp. 3263]|jgi:hypothetical protein|uniref:DUF4870 domain-containing protein n=1 Tax=Agromyces sp. 3263 TaxID=2817750 RepID=UPI0028597FDB|nr:DUF4870 domain-containing protein [Agromyces sp. 3263]MDR6907083.1 putative Tic20 family protein [Agromyces sp. 3263]